MFKIFIDHNKVLDIIQNDINSNWYKILSKQKKIFVNDLNDDDCDDPLNLFSLGTGGVQFCDETKYMKEVIVDNKKVLENPCGAFYLNIDSIIANEIQSNFGVICQNCNEMDSKILTFKDIDIYGADRGCTWERFPFSLEKFPINTLIIQDRYFCSSEHGESIDDTYQNFEKIIKALLPTSYNDEFHLMVIIDAKKINPSDHITFDDISNQFNTIKEEIENERKYKILLEVFSIPKDSYHYSKTHDRYIVTNYYMIGATHKLKAFREGEVLTEQTLTSKCLYSKGLDSNFSDSPIVCHNKWISDFRDIVKYSTTRPSVYKYSCNGTNDSGTINIKNRILVEFV